jgi:DNA-binding protein HU-beta
MWESIMNKTDLIKTIAEKSGSTLKDAGKFLDVFTDTLSETLKKGEDVALVGFGTFSRVERSARIGRNFGTGKSIKVPASKAVRFKVGKTHKESVNHK